MFSNAEPISELEINNALLLSEQRIRPTGSPVMIIVSLLFIALGVWQINKGGMVWGIIILAWGVISFIIRILPYIRK